jgi:hypothetical protein
VNDLSPHGPENLTIVSLPVEVLPLTGYEGTRAGDVAEEGDGLYAEL